MSAKPKNTPLTTAQLISPGQATPSYPDGGLYTVKSAPITINATKDQILQTLLRLDDYHAWNNFTPNVTNIVHPENSKTGTPDSERSATIATVGTTFTFSVRLFPTFPFIKTKSTERITSISKTDGVYVVSWVPLDIPGERVHVISESEEGYGTCVYESYETFQKSTKTMITRFLFGSVLKRGFDEWSRDLKRRVEEYDW
ncbi:hypothetical protein ABW20_dc0104005 [Dactylellina cionopaga]|nr:hypothetical protein ABW20_dc0104005 [Dactylellina cionopaga]